MSSHSETATDPYRKVIVALSVVIPVVVAILFGMPKIQGYDTSFLPPIYATINALTAIFLVVAFFAIKRGNRALHEGLMKTCLYLSAAFLLMYVVYHLTSETTRYGGEGAMKGIYLFILATHILLSIGVIPFVLFTFARALYGNFPSHKKIARWTFPIWLYVATTGVIVYIMISPYYQQ